MSLLGFVLLRCDLVNTFLAFYTQAVAIFSHTFKNPFCST
jgi:hypothetical protein